MCRLPELGVEPFLKVKGKKRAGVWLGATPLAVMTKAVGSILSTETSKQADGFAQREERGFALGFRKDNLFIRHRGAFI